MGGPARFGPSSQPYGAAPPGRREAANLADILERVLDRGVVIAGDIRVNLLDIELLTIKLRLLIASVDTARELGIDWWEHDPWLSSGDRDLIEENRRLRRRLAALEEEEPGVLRAREARRELEEEEEEPKALRAHGTRRERGGGRRPTRERGD